MHLYTRDADRTRVCDGAPPPGEPGGRFAFDVLLPDPVSLARRSLQGVTAGGEVPHPRDGVRYRYREYFSYEPLYAQIETIVMDFEHPE